MTNPLSLVNVERHPTQRGVYLAYGLGRTWRVRREARNYWRAWTCDSGKPDTIESSTLTALGRYLEPNQ